MQIHAIQPAQPTPLITLKNINVVFEQKTALRDINLSIYPNSIITIVGPNGGGKSTLLKTLLKLQTPTSGEVIYSTNVRIGYVPQKIHLDHSLPMTVERFLALKKGVKTQEISTALEQLSITHLRKNNMQKLSGGEMQRVLLARAILNKPNLLVLDEPTQGVDINGQAELYQLIHRTCASINTFAVPAHLKAYRMIQHLCVFGAIKSHKMWAFIRTIIITTIICMVMFVVAVPIHQNANNKEKSCLRFYFPPCLRAYCFP